MSELFQSQMLQPLNTTPIQPSLGESNLFLISSQGPGALAFNEFNPLFNRNQVNAQGSFLVGEDSTLAGRGHRLGHLQEALLQRRLQRLQRPTASARTTRQDDKIANAFVQAELSPEHEPAGRGAATGTWRRATWACTSTRTTSARSRRRRPTAPASAFGLRQEFGPALTLLASYMHSDKDIDFALPDPDLGQSFDARPRGEGRQRRGAAALPLAEGQGRGRRRATSTSTPTRRPPSRSTTPTSGSPTSRPATRRSSTPTSTPTPTSRPRRT